MKKPYAVVPWKYFEVLVIYHWIKQVIMQQSYLLYELCFLHSDLQGNHRHCQQQDVKAAFFSHRSISCHLLQNPNCESFSTKYLDPYRLCIMRLVLHPALIAWQIGLLLLLYRNLFSKKLVSNNFNVQGKSPRKKFIFVVLTTG